VSSCEEKCSKHGQAGVSVALLAGHLVEWLGQVAGQGPGEADKSGYLQLIGSWWFA